MRKIRARLRTITSGFGISCLKLLEEVRGVQSFCADHSSGSAPMWSRIDRESRVSGMGCSEIELPLRNRELRRVLQ